MMKVFHNTHLVLVWIIAALAVVFCLGGCVTGGGETEWSFDTDDLGAVPRGWEVAETAGVGKTAQWQVIRDDSAPGTGSVVAVTKTENSGHTFNLLIATQTQYTDVEVEVKVKAISGKADQGGGPIWRVIDADNYYIARWNPLENNFRVYYVKDGSRKQLASADVDAAADAWHEIEIVHVGNRITAEFDDEKLLDIEDATFTEAGKVGLWTKADAATAFDDFEVEKETVGRTVLNKSLTKAAPKGFSVAFNGEDLSGWKGVLLPPYDNPVKRAALDTGKRTELQAAADEHMHKHWSVADGVLVFDGKGFSLSTAEDYGDFEMFVDWEIGPHGDSGIYLRGSPQVQIWDPADRPEGSGGLFNNKKNPSKPLVCADKPIGQWNTFYIKMVGERVTVDLNGKRIVESVILENYWDRKQSIFPAGPIELQCHGHKIWFNNIFIRRINPKS